MAVDRPLTRGARQYAMVVLTVVYMFNFIDRQILAILLPAIRDEFQVGDTVLGLLSGAAFALFYVTLGLPVARLTDRLNRRNLLAAALAIWSGMTAVSGLATNVVHLTLARIGVGIGEAGCSPAAHAMISDYYPPERRATAMGVYTLGIALGIMLAFMVGGWVAQNIGWREAFFIVGLPGLALALAVRFTVVEPERGASEVRTDSGRTPDVRIVARVLLARKSFVHMGIAAGLASFVGYAVVNFYPSFAVRSYGIGPAQLGFWLGPIVGIGAGLGYVGGGYLSDRIARAGRERPLRLFAVLMLVSVPLFAVVFLAETHPVSLLTLFLPVMLSNAYLPTVFSQAQGLVALRMRALTSAVMLFIINVIGLALGPSITGIVSDLLQPRYGDESLRFALLGVCSLILPWSAWHFFRAGRTIDADLARATEFD